MGYDLDVHFTYIRNPKFIAPDEIDKQETFLHLERGDQAQPLSINC
ncbi:MAG: hypothetical protein IJQ39_09700 [Thermoguttaceae bacterium]|nr:hypothetical protein [Thermoguttaceae bacterium]